VARRSWRSGDAVADGDGLVAALAALEDPRYDLGVETEAWSRSVTEWDRFEQCGVFVDPSAGEPIAACEVVSIDQFWRLARAVVEGLRLVA